jgi:hypothetical protein
MDGVFSLHGRDEKCVENCRQKTWNEHTTCHLGRDWRIILSRSTCVTVDGVLIGEWIS